MKRVLPYISLLAFTWGMVWAIYLHLDKKAEVRRDREEKRQEAILSRIAHMDTLIETIQDSLLAYSIRQMLIDRDLATAEARVYRLRHPLPEGEPR